MPETHAGNKNMPFVLFLSVLLILSAFILRPFFSGIAWAVIFSTLAYPLYRCVRDRLFSGRFENLAAALTALAILCFMLLPVVFIAAFIAQEAASAYDTVMKAGGVMPVFQSVFDWLHTLPVIGSRLANWETISAQPYFANIATGLLKWASDTTKMFSLNLVSGAAKFLMLFAVVGMTSFYLLRDGAKIAAFISDILPLSENKKSELFTGTKNMLRAVVYGVVFTGFIQGVLGGIGWYFVKLPNPVFFGFMMFICGMIPMVGTPVVWVFAVIYLLAAGDNYHAFILFAWCAGVVCTTDNIVRPIFISGGSDVNMLVIFLGLFGGLYLWGFAGLFIGPLVLSLCLFFLNIYRARTA